jgi:hypothetical protein
VVLRRLPPTTIYATPKNEKQENLRLGSVNTRAIRGALDGRLREARPMRTRRSGKHTKSTVPALAIDSQFRICKFYPPQTKVFFFNDAPHARTGSKIFVGGRRKSSLSG